MNKLQVLIVIFAIATISSAATISLVGPAAGEPGSRGHLVMPSETIVIKIVSDAPVLSMDAIVSVDGPASVAGATDIATGVQKHGWDAGFAAETIVTLKSATFAAGNFNGLGPSSAAYPKVIGEILIHFDWKKLLVVTISICGNDQLGGSLNFDGLTPAQFGPPIVLVDPEPISLALLGLGGLFLARRRT